MNRLKEKKTMILLGIIAVILLAVIFTVAGQGGSSSVAEQLSLGDRFLSEMSYEKAIVAFEKVLSIDPKNVEAYLGLAESYICQNEFDKAMDVLRQGLTAVGENEVLQKRLEEIGSKNFSDFSGRTRMRSGYDGDGNLVWYHTITYNAQGKEDTITSFNAAAVQTGQVMLEYNERGRSTTGYHYGSDSGVLGKIAYDYNAEGKEIKSTLYDPDGTVRSWNIMDYNAEGKQIKCTWYDTDGTVRGWDTRDYNAEGKEIKSTYYDTDGTILGWDIYDYNAEGKLIKHTHYNADGTIWDWDIYDYNAEGKRIKRTSYNADGTVRSITTYD